LALSSELRHDHEHRAAAGCDRWAAKKTLKVSDDPPVHAVNSVFELAGRMILAANNWLWRGLDL
jgi:hypothetical protein